MCNGKDEEKQIHLQVVEWVGVLISFGVAPRLFLSQCQLQIFVLGFLPRVRPFPNSATLILGSGKELAVQLQLPLLLGMVVLPFLLRTTVLLLPLEATVLPVLLPLEATVLPVLLSLEATVLPFLLRTAVLPLLLEATFLPFLLQAAGAFHKVAVPEQVLLERV